MPGRDDGDTGTDAPGALSMVAHGRSLETLRALWAANGHSLFFSALRPPLAFTTPDSSTTTSRS